MSFTLIFTLLDQLKVCDPFVILRKRYFLNLCDGAPQPVGKGYEIEAERVAP